MNKCLLRDVILRVILMKLVISVMAIIIGGTAFWGSFGIVIFITGSNYGGKTVGFLTLFTPITIWLSIWAWYKKYTLEKKGISPAIIIGIVGPIITTFLYSLVVLIIPALSAL